jgi:hypothetical protein
VVGPACFPVPAGREIAWRIWPTWSIRYPLEAVAQLWGLVCVAAVTVVLPAKPCAIPGQAAHPEASSRS